MNLEYIGTGLTLLGITLGLSLIGYRIVRVKISKKNISRPELIKDTIFMGIFGFIISLGLILFMLPDTSRQNPALDVYDFLIIIFVTLSCLTFFTLSSMIVYALGMIRYGYADLKSTDEQEQ